MPAKARQTPSAPARSRTRTGSPPTLEAETLILSGLVLQRKSPVLAQNQWQAWLCLRANARGRGLITCSLQDKQIAQEQGGTQPLTILVEELKDGRLLGIEEECGHVIVGLIGTKKGLDT